MSRRSAADELTTTSYALLGMLAIRSWSTYELAKTTDRNLGRLWPSARSHLFSEPRKLVTLGLAKAEEEMVGRRPRTVYAITSKGRRALRAWLALPGEAPLLHFEQLLKLFFADHGTKADALAAVRHMRDWADEQAQIHAAVARSYLDGTGPFPERAAVLSVVGPFLAEFAQTVGRWAEHAEEIVGSWPEDLRLTEPDWEAFEKVARRPEVHGRQVGRRAGLTGRSLRRSADPSDFPRGDGIQVSGSG
jgi:DNA-binding PadR family transcriptional regulator